MQIKWPEDECITRSSEKRLKSTLIYVLLMSKQIIKLVLPVYTCANQEWDERYEIANFTRLLTVVKEVNVHEKSIIG